MLRLQRPTRAFGQMRSHQAIEDEMLERESASMVGPSGGTASNPVRLVSGLGHLDEGTTGDGDGGRQGPGARGTRHRHGATEAGTLPVACAGEAL